jgi:hypothetical protein
MDHVMKEAKELLVWALQVKDQDKDWRETIKKAAQAVQDAFWRLMKSRHFEPENAVLEARKEHQSPSGKYRLVVTPYKTGPNSWNYTLGQVYEGDRLIAEVQRNYSAFPFAWVENHPNGHPFLVCGEDYQGQTVIELDTGRRVDYLPQGAKRGVGFCWVEIHPSPKGDMLAVEGCYWACPYEVVIHDFSDPLDPPWPELSRDDCKSFGGWNEDGTCLVGVRADY